MSSEIKKCNRCEVDKTITDFYKYTKGIIKSICKRCEMKSPARYILWHCVDCDLIIRHRYKVQHLKTKRHLLCYFTNEKYIQKNLQKQNTRKSV